jgi:CarD family transcriptional regulator
MVAPSKSKKTTSSKTKKTGAASRAKPTSKRTTKGASSSSARNRVTKSKAASNTRAARKTTKTTRAKAKTVATKLSKRKRTSGSVKAVAHVTAAKKAASAAARKAAAAKSVSKTIKTAAAAKAASAVRTPLKEQEAKLTPANRNAPEVRAAEKVAASPSASKPSPSHSVPVPPSVAAASPAKPVAPVVKVQAAPVVKVQKAEEAPSAAKTLKPTGQRQGFRLNEFVVYPAHGVGQIVAIEEQEVAGFKLELFVISFSKDKLTLRVPTSKVTGVGMRKISDTDTAKRSLDILTGRARVKRTMWSRRAQEYETKINSGDINAIAEVVRDLYRSEAQPEQSYSERQLYEAALDRMVREIAAVQKSSEIDALKAVEAQLQKGQSRAAKALPAPSAAGEIEEQAA